ncbi:AAA family ATPase [Shewanella colwelliana]|uniref:AAA family ATPase n=1 Tax=Shewanella colwelliana TaxID=23 RepID=A0A1E5IYA5_SHECO|nr:DUF4011 domain-containing anti-phage protein Hhe [Shewanella colwelliana]OEG75486.1 AAA family ATPase [Shewanella colwelliana]
MSNLSSAVLKALEETPNQTAKGLAQKFDTNKKSINQCLYFDLKDKVQINAYYQWSLIKSNNNTPERDPLEANDKERDATMENQASETTNDNFAFDSLQAIRNRLLDLTGRNRLLNFRHGKSGFIRVIDEMPNQLATELLDNHQFKFTPVDEPKREELIEHGYIAIDDKGQEIQIKSDPTAKEWAKIKGLNTSYELPVSTKSKDSKHKDSNIQSILYPRELEAQLRNIRSKANTAIEETGANILYLAFGFLEWFEDENSDVARQAPLYLIPVKVDRASLDKKIGTYTYTVEYTSEDIIPNLSLSQKLKHDFHIHLPEIEDDLLPEEYFDLVEQTVLRQKPQWTLKRFSTLAMFDFGKLLMYLDLDPERWPQGENNIQNHSILQKFFAKEGMENGDSGSSFGNEYAIDQLADVHERYPLIDDADSSQHSALVDSIEGKNVVIEGPPGSGKSQTITNLIAAAISQGKKVLFVAEKMAALQVVKTRLQRAGLGDFCLELHSHKTQKKQVYENISQRIHKQGEYRYPSSIDIDIQMYEEKKQSLSDYAELINSPWKNTGRTIHQVFATATRYREEFASVKIEEIKPSHINGGSFDEVSLIRTTDELKRYADVYNEVKTQLGSNAELSDHPWFGVYNKSIQLFDCDDICALLIPANDSLTALAHASISLSEQVGGDALDSIDSLEKIFSDEEILPELSGREDFTALTSIFKDETVKKQLLVYLKEYKLARDILLQITAEFESNVLTDASALDSIAASSKILKSLFIEDNSKLSAIFNTAQKTSTLHQLYLSLMQDVSTLKEQLPNLSESLKSDFNSFVELYKYLSYFSKLENTYISRRDELFDNDLLDQHLPKLLQIITELKVLRERLEVYFDLNQLPTVAELKSVKETFAEAGYFCWFDSSWRDARGTLLRISNNKKQKTKKLVKHLSNLISYRKLLDQLNSEPLYRTLLQGEYQGIDTPIEEIAEIRGWYAEVRASFGIGFGRKVQYADSLLASNDQLFKGIKHLATSKTIQELADFSQLHQDISESITHAIFNDHDLDFGDELHGIASLYAKLNSSVKSLQTACANDLTLTQLSLCLEQAEQLKQLDLKLAERQSCCDIFVELDPLSALKNCDSSVEIINDTLVLNEAIQKLQSSQLQGYFLTPVTKDNVQALRDTINAVKQQYHHYISSFRHFEERTELDEMAWYDVDDSTIASMITRNQTAIDQPRWLSTWIDFVRIRTSLSEKGLENLLRYTEKGELELNEIQQIYTYSVFDILAREIITERQALAHFSGADQNAIRKQFSEYDNKLKKLQQEKIAFQVASHGFNKTQPGITGGRVSSYTEMGLINHQVNLKTRHAPVRQLVNRASQSLVALKPCFMMGPHSVAQYLTPGLIEFDIIVMDEASQIKPEDALGTIARGKQLVVVGDPKQLPPTSFFDKAIEVEDEDITAIEQSESILDVSLPMFNARRLRWHYRSRHESLIAFSNQTFYDSNLVVFPSPSSKSDEFGIKFTHVKHGRFVNQHNIEEAKVIAEAVRKHLLHRPDESLGVVSMSAKQREQIERCVEELSKDDTQFRDALASNANTDEPLFLKNLENVQGDERDVIYISCTYGPQDAGAAQMPQRFGPINSAAGGRRLNVLFTRSKKRMHVFSSMTEGHILASDTSSPGVHALKSFLAYAQTGKLAQQTHTGKQPDSDFEIAVMNALKLEGFNCVPQVGVAGYFIDLAVQDPGQPGRYLMGVECDGATYHSAKSARDRDRLRQSVLEGLGWNIKRIWSTDWFKNPQAQLKPIIELLHQLKTEPTQHTVDEAEFAESEVNDIEQVVEQEELQLKSVESFCKNDDSLASKLEKFDQAVISPSSNNVPLANRLLRPAMIAALCEFKPISKSEFLEMIPAYLRNATGSEQGEYLEQVLNIIAESELEMDES